jgi:glycosyltransferase involved in cell wall biosynthesis
VKKNILEVCLSPNLGGLELFSFHCYQAFKERSNCKIAVAFNEKLDHYFDSDDKIYIQRNKFLPFIPAWNLSKYIDKNKIEVIHFHWTKDIITVVLAKMFSKQKPKIIQSRHMGMTRFKNDLYHRFLYKNISIIHAITQQVADQLKKYIPQEVCPEIVLVYLGVKKKQKFNLTSLRKLYNIKDEYVIGIVGRIEEKKGQHIVIEALGKLKDLKLKLFIIGHYMDEVYMQKLRDIVIKYDIKDKVVFTGFTKEVDAYMQLCDVTVLATENEAFGLVVIESMANGTPVIATNRGGPLEIIDDGVDGLFYDGSVEELSKKIRYLYNNIEKRKNIKQNALQKVEKKFDELTQLEKLYTALIG